MVETTTKNYALVKPEIQHSPATWGGFLNNDLDSIDALLYANQQGQSPIGSGALWFTPTPPSGWLICNGASLATTGTYANLFAAIGYTYGGSGANFNLPNLIDVFPFGGGNTVAVGGAGGEVSHTLAESEMPSHKHSITDVAHSHGAYQAAHSHYVYQDAHSHSANQDPHNHSVNGVLTVAGPGVAPGSGSQAGGGTTSTAQPGVHIDTQQPGVHADTQQPAVTINASGTGLSATNYDGGSAAHNNMPPYLGISFIIRYM